MTGLLGFLGGILAIYIWRGELFPFEALALTSTFLWSKHLVCFVLNLFKKVDECLIRLDRGAFPILLTVQFVT